MSLIFEIESEDFSAGHGASDVFSCKKRCQRAKKQFFTEFNLEKEWRKMANRISPGDDHHN